MLRITQKYTNARCNKIFVLFCKDIREHFEYSQICGLYQKFDLKIQEKKNVKFLPEVAN